MENTSAYFEGIILESCHCQDPTFKITIPYLFSTREDKDSGNDNVKHKMDEDNSLLNKNYKVNDFEGTTVIIAKNHTDYAFQLKGDTYEMKSSKGQVLNNMLDSGGIVLVPVAPLSPHWHKIRDKFEFYNYIFENLNNVPVQAGTKCYGFFINGVARPDNFAVTRIEGVVPLNKGQAPKYKK